MSEMVKRYIIICMTALAGSVCLANTNAVKQVVTGFKFTEGPTPAPNGDIYFTDSPNRRIHIWSTKGELSTFREDSGMANGLQFDKTGNLVICEGETRQVTSTSPKGKVTVLADNFEGKKLNSPNDLWNAPNGGIYFTDPRYGKKDNLEQDGEHVYYIPPKGKTIIKVIADMVRPNGIIGTPDGKTLYVTDHGDKKTFSYTINKDGTLSTKKMIIEEGSDGMILDSKGNLYLTTDAVLVYSPKGILIKKIEIPERPTNVCISGHTLFITARTSLYSIEL